MHGFSRHYIDDLLIRSATYEEHATRLKLIFGQLTHENLKFYSEKSFFPAEKVKFLRHRLSWLIKKRSIEVA